MHSLLSGEDLVGGVSSNPALPNILSQDLGVVFSSLEMYTGSLRVLAAPRELCVLKALELMTSRRNYEVNVEAFRMELLSQFLDTAGMVEIDALVKGIQCICNHLWEVFDNYSKLDVEFFPYEFYCLHQDRYLFLSKIVFDASIPTPRPTALAKPAYTYPEVQASHRADYSTQADHALYL